MAHRETEVNREGGNWVIERERPPRKTIERWRKEGNGFSWVEESSVEEAGQKGEHLSWKERPVTIRLEHWGSDQTSE